MEQPILETPLERDAGTSIALALEDDDLPSLTISSRDSSWGVFLTFAELREFIANAETVLLWAAQRGVSRA